MSQTRNELQPYEAAARELCLGLKHDPDAKVVDEDRGTYHIRWEAIAESLRLHHEREASLLGRL